MITHDQLIDSIHQIIGKDLLAKSQKLDTNANGVQIHGAKQVKKVAIGVSANMDFLKEAVKDQAQFCIFHHGLGLNEKYVYNSRLNPALEAQLKFAFANNLTIAGYHFSLDHHPEIGNNAVIINRIGAKKTDEPYFDEWGWVGEFEKPQDVESLAQKCSEIFEHDVFAVYAGPSKIKRIGVVSGGGKPIKSWLFEVFEKHIDLHITGEIGEGGPALAKGIGFNYFACGHYATEVFGVQELGKKLKAKFKDKLDIEFIDVPNPI